MTYNYNPHKHVKIWLSTEKNVFLTPKNQLRLIQMRSTNPEDEINLIFDSQLLLEEEKAKLLDFCKKLNIMPFDIHDLFLDCTTPEEKNLISIYKEYMRELNEGVTNDKIDLVVRCRDIICWLKPIYTLGTISDLDDFVNTSKIKTIKVEKPLLINVGCTKTEENNYFTLLNNNIIAVVNPKAALPLIQKIQRNIFNACTSFSKGTSYFVTEQGHARFSGNVEGEKDLLELHDYSQGSSILAARKIILEFCASNETFRRFHNLSINKMIAQKKQQYALELLKLGIQAKESEIALSKSILSSKNLKNNQKEEIQAREIQSAQNFMRELGNKMQELTKLFTNDEELIKKTRENTKLVFIHQSVLCTTGPLNICYSLFGNERRSWQQIKKQVTPFSLAHYQLERIFPKSEILESQELLTNNKQPKVKSDMSWLPIEQDDRVKNEKLIKNAVLTLQGGILKYNAEKQFSELKFFKSSTQESKENVLRNVVNPDNQLSL